MNFLGAWPGLLFLGWIAICVFVVWKAMKRSLVGALLILLGVLLATCSGLYIAGEIAMGGAMTGRSALEQLGENLHRWPFFALCAGLLLLVFGIIVVQVRKAQD